MGNYLSKIQSDLGGYFFSKIRYVSYIVNKKFFSFYMLFLLKAKNISIGGKCIFYGRSYFFKYPESNIRIGSHCIFDSSRFHNLIGVDKCCTLSTLSPQANLTIGTNSGFSGVRIGCLSRITIGNDCLVGANVLITDTDWHPIDPAQRHEAMNSPHCKAKPIQIGNNVFIGVNSIILKGSVIGDNSVIGAGSVVSGVIPPNVIAGGNPCRVIKTLS